MLMVRVQSNSCSSPHPWLEPGLLSRQKTPTDQTLSKDFFHTLFLGHDSCNRQPLDFLGNIYNMMIVCSRPLHHLEGVGESHPTRSHLTSFASLENHNEIHFGSNCGCGHGAGQCLLFALRASFVYTHQH